LLNTDYVGDAVVVRRASDNATQSISFVDGELDVDTLNTFCSGTDGFITTWFDQSGNGYDAAQTIASEQPQIYDSINGIVLENGKPATLFNGSNAMQASSIDSSEIITTNAENTFVSVIKQDGTEERSTLASFSPEVVRYVIYSKFNDSIFYDAGDNTTNRLQTPTPTGWDDNQHLLFLSSSLTLQEINVDSQQLAADTSQTTILNGSVSLIIGTRLNVYFKGLIQEIIIYNSDQSSNRTGIETNINNFYSIY
jgi:hypothetical protein